MNYFNKNKEEIADFNSIKQQINEFKTKKSFDEQIYLNILQDLDNCYNYKSKQLFQKWNNKEEVSKVKEEFRIYLINNIFIIANQESISKNYNSSLQTIQKLEKLIKPSDFEMTNNLNKLKSYCEFEINTIEGKDLLQKNKYRESINFFKNLINISSHPKHNEIYSKFLFESKSCYIKNILKENIDLLQSNNYVEILNKCELILNEFEYESKLKHLIVQTKKLYAMTLEKKIEEELKKNMLDINDYEKYKSLIETENIKDNKIEEFKLKIDNMFEQANKNIIQSEEKIVKNNNNDINKNIKINKISLETINKYLKLIKYINEGKLSEELENEIKIQINNYNEEIQNNNYDVNQWILSNQNNIKNNNFRGNIFAIFNKINKKITTFDIRPIQLISLLFLTKKESNTGGIFLQINTGEGKSLIIQFLAAYLALLGKKVDIISSNSVLANRDAEDKNIIEFYNNLNLSVGCASKNEYTKNIVYGDTQNFEAGILREEFKEKNIRKNRPFDCVIIDEVDSISLDNIITMTQLTDNFPGRSSFFYFYYQILMLYCNIINELPKYTGKTQEYFLKKPDEFKEIIEKQIRNIFKEKILENDGKTLKTENIPIIYPKCMKKYIEDSLNTWINNVIKAPIMIENRDFIIKNNNIVPVDYSNTGVLQDNMVWDGGLQQILQIIHNVKGTFENENTNFLSNISFFKRYKGNIYGVTGTFGGENFQFILKTIYKISLYKIPPNKTSLLEDMGSLVCTDENIYIKNILDNIKAIISQKRSVLLISNSIGKGKEFYDILKEEYKENVMKYFTEEDKKAIENVLEPEKIIVATNLVGRGTDIKISDELEKNGGLHVLVTFLPLNQRIEEQNYGRAGRKGQKGSHYLIMLYKNEYGNLNKNELTIDNIKKIRDKLEFDSINSLIENEMKIILKKEDLFNDFCKYLKNDCKKYNNYEKSYIEEKWGILLKDKNIENIEKNYIKLKSEKKHNIENNLIKIKDIVNNSDNSKNFYKQIFDLEPEYSWVAKIRYSCILAKEKVWWLSKIKNKFKKQQTALKELNSVKTIIDTFIGDLSCQSTLDKMVFSFFIKNAEKLKNNNFKTEIEIQNDNRKNFLEVIKNLIDENIETIQKYINENNQNNSLETDKLLTIEDIIKKTDTINIIYKKDIKNYMDEFGFNTFEILIIKKNKNYIANLIIIALGVLEFCAGAALLAYSANPYLFKLASYLIREGIKDIVKGVKACIEGEEINLKYYAIEKGISLVCFAIELVIGKVPEKLTDTFKTKIVSVVKNECISLAKSYGNRYVANKIVKKLISKLSGKIKYFFINPLMDTIKLNGENIDKYIQYDILNDSDIYKNAILKQTEKILDQLDYLLDFIGPIIEIIKILGASNSEKTEKIAKFAEYMSTFDYQGLIQISKNIYELVKNTKVDVNIDNNLSSVIKSSYPSLNDEEIDIICRELIECKIINKNGKFDDKFIKIKNFKQIFDIKIDDKYMGYEYIEGKQCSEELENKLNFIAIKISETVFNNKKNEIKDEIYTQLETFMESIIQRILLFLEDKVDEQFEKLLKKFKEKKAMENQEIENEEKKEKKKENNENEENEEIQVVKKTNQTCNDQEENNLVLPELNNEEIKKNQNKINNEIDDNNSLLNKKPIIDNNEINDVEINISSKKEKQVEKEEKGKENKKKDSENKDKKEEIKEENNKKNEEKKEKGLALRKEKGTNKFMNGICKFTLQYGFKEGFKIVIIPKFIDAVSDWFKNILNEKLLPLLLNKFDIYFEKLGTHIIILQKKYNIKKYADNILKKIKKFFHIIMDIQLLITPFLKDAIKKAKKEGVDILQIINELINKLFSKIDDIIKPMKDFVDKVFDGNEKLEAYKLYENVIIEGYKNIRKKGIEEYEKIKNIVGEKYTKVKEEYLQKRKEICSLPDELEKKFQEKKDELVKKYKEIGDNIIKSTNKKIEELKKMNLEEEFRQFFRSIKNNINDKLNEIKKETKNKINTISSKIPNFIDNFTNLIDNILKINFGPYDNNKIDICEHISTFILEVESGNIKVKYENENKEVIEKTVEELLINYLKQKLNIEADQLTDIIAYLFQNKLNSIIMGKINDYLINYANKELDAIKSYYKPTLMFIKNYFGIFKGNISNFINQFRDKINSKIDCFDYFIEYINEIFENNNLFDFYCFVEKNILINKEFRNTLLDNINNLKDKLITSLSTKLENETNKLYEKIINSNKYKELKEKSTKTINDFVDKAENKVFGHINNILKDIDNKNNEKEIKDKNIDKNLEKKDDEKNNEKIIKEKKDKKESEFDKFDKNIGKVIDNKISSNAAELEQKLLQYAKNLDEQAQEYLKLKFGNKIDKKIFDDIFNSINILKEKKNKLFESEKIKNDFKKLDNALYDIATSKPVEKSIKFIDGINVKLANEILDEIEKITPLLETKTKEDFRDNFKKLIKEKIYQCYEKFLEPKLKELVIGLGEKIIDKITEKKNKINN